MKGLEGVQVTTYAFKQGLPFPAGVSAFVLMLCLVFFAFTTILGWDYYSERCLEYLTNGQYEKSKSIPLVIYSCSIYRTLHDSKCCMDHRRYLQWSDGNSEYDRTVCIEWSRSKRNKSISLTQRNTKCKTLK